MNKTRKHKRDKKRHKRKNKTVKRNHYREILLPTRTPLQVRKVSNKIAHQIVSGSYSPTINKQLVTLKSIERSDLMNCNTEEAFRLKEPLQIGIKNNCYYYYTPEAKQFLLHNLAANKHIDSKKIIPPIQSKVNNKMDL